jgi:hypothetical protein
VHKWTQLMLHTKKIHLPRPWLNGRQTVKTNCRFCGSNTVPPEIAFGCGTRSELQSGALPGELKRLDSCLSARAKNNSSFANVATIFSRHLEAASRVVQYCVVANTSETRMLIEKSWLYWKRRTLCSLVLFIFKQRSTPFPII